MLKSLSVFFPAYNEEGNIKDTVEKAIGVLKKLKIERWEIVIVDDGSTDNTPKVSDGLADKHPQVTVIHQPNGGYGKALITGFTAGKYEWIVYTDSDGQFDFSEITKFVEKTPDFDLIYGYRIKRNDPFMRLVNAKGWKLMIWLFFGLYLRDVDCGFKMAKKELIEKISPLKSSRGGMINAELAIKSQKEGFKIAQVGVHHYARVSGKPTGASLKVIINSFWDLFKLRLQIR